ncbi:MAG: hypothetical protein HC892_09360 [Saprospiraceae bacterium]|nr:hypothetical protein [Saprospiraceae bacterium]
MKVLPKIAIIIPYFGQWPVWINYFMESCRHNPKIDWLIHTDCGKPDNVPSNVTIKHIRFDQYCQRVSAALGIAFRPNSAYKLCDLKPAYGHIHQKEIEGYDFWGFGDIDVIYGDLQGYLTAKMLAHNLISFHGHRISGHLCMVKNTTQMRELYRKIKGWQGLLENPDHRCFDEKSFNALFIPHKRLPKLVKRVIFFQRYLIRPSFFQEAFSTNFSSAAWIDGSFDFPAVWHWRYGVLTCNKDNERSFPYLHFMTWKKNWIDSLQFTGNWQDGHWHISESGIKTETCNK